MAQVTSPSGQYSLLYFLPLLLYPSPICISILALHDRRHKDDFSNWDFPLLLMILKGKLPHREQCAHRTYFKCSATIAVSGRTYGWAATFTPFISQQLENSFFLKKGGHSEFCFLKLLPRLPFWSSHYRKACINASYRAISAQEFASQNSQLVYKLPVFHILEITYSSGHCSMQLRKKKLEELSAGTAEKESCAIVCFCTERN